MEVRDGLGDGLVLPEPLLSRGRELGLGSLSPFQRASLEALAQGRDLLARAASDGSSEVTLALAALGSLRLELRAVQVLVVCGNRLRAEHVGRLLRRWSANSSRISLEVAAEGLPLREERSALARGLHVLVATPKRLHEHLARGALGLEELTLLLVDGRLDKPGPRGLPDVEALLRPLQTASRAPPRTLLLYTGAGPTDSPFASALLRTDYARLEEAAPARPEAGELVLEVPRATKLVALRWALENLPHEAALVFANSEPTVVQLARTLLHAGTAACAFERGQSIEQRALLLERFEAGTCNVLIASDREPPERPLPRADLLVHYDLPHRPGTYLDRLGHLEGRGLTLCITSEGESARLRPIELERGSPLDRLRVALPQAGILANASATGRLATLVVSAGRKQNLARSELLRVLTGHACGLNAADVGDIDVQETFSYVSVTRAAGEQALAALRRVSLRGRRRVVWLVP